MIWNDIISPEGISIDVSRKSAYISSCRVRVYIEAKQRGPFIRRKMLADANMVLPPRTEAIVPFVSLDLPDDHDFLFYPSPASQSLTFFSHLLDHRVQGVLACNDSDQPVRVPRKLRLGVVSEVYFENCYHSGLTSEHAACSPGKSAAARAAGVTVAVPHVDLALETRLSNGIIVYGKPEVVAALSLLTNSHRSGSHKALSTYCPSVG